MLKLINAEVVVCLEDKLLGSNSSQVSLKLIRLTRSLTQRYFLTESEISDLKRERKNNLMQFAIKQL